MKWKDRIKDALYIGLGLFLIGILMLNADISSTMETMISIDLHLIILVLSLYFFNTGCKVIRWFGLLRGMGGRNLSPILLPIFLSSLALNNSTPGKVGGEPVRALMLKEHTDNDVSLGVATIFAEKSLDILTILFLALIGIIYLILELGFNDVKWMALAVGAGGIVFIFVILLVMSRRFIGWVSGTIKKIALVISGGKDGSKLHRISEKISSFMVRFHGSISNLKKDPSRGFGVIILTLVIWLNEALRLYIIVNAIPGNHNLIFPGAIAGIAVANILGFILPMGGSGNVIGSKSVLDLLIRNNLISTSSSIVQVATSLWISLPLGAISLFYLRGEKRRRRSKENA